MSYDSRAWLHFLQDKYSKENVKCGTMPLQGGRGTKNAGIFYPNEGMSVFDDVCVCDLFISPKISSIKDRFLHFKEATEKLDDLIEFGGIFKELFTPEQHSAIVNHEANIPGFTWHHHEQYGRLQLVPTQIHKNTPHDDGFFLWYEDFLFPTID